MPIPIELSGAAIAGIFVLMALVAVVLSWAMCVIVDEWREAGWLDEELRGMAGDEEKAE